MGRSSRFAAKGYGCHLQQLHSPSLSAALNTRAGATIGIEHLLFTMHRVVQHSRKKPIGKTTRDAFNSREQTYSYMQRANIMASGIGGR